MAICTFGSKSNGNLCFYWQSLPLMVFFFLQWAKSNEDRCLASKSNGDICFGFRSYRDLYLDSKSNVYPRLCSKSNDDFCLEFKFNGKLVSKLIDIFAFNCYFTLGSNLCLGFKSNVNICFGSNYNVGICFNSYLCLGSKCNDVLCL